jgi:hypothetical protein
LNPRHIAKSILHRLGFQRKLNHFSDRSYLEMLQKKKLGLEAHSREVTTLMLGSSHANFAAVGNVELGCYNLGLPSADLFTSFHLYRNTSNRLTRLENLVVFFSVFSPGFDLSKTRERYRCISYSSFFGIPYSPNLRIKPEIERKIKEACKRLPASENKPCYWGYEKNPYFHAPASERVASHLRENVREPDQMNWMKEILSLAHTQGHRVYIVIPPVRSDYKMALPSDTDTDIFGKLHSIDLGKNRVIDFFSSNIFDDNHMGDPDHMNLFGAQKLTKELFEIIHNDWSK